MARGTTLLRLVEMLRAEMGHSLSTALGVDKVENLKQLLRSTQEFFYDEYDWPHMRVRRDIDLEAGSRYYDLPADLNFERVERTDVRWASVWLPIRYGITMADYSAYDSDDDDRADPVAAWSVIDAGGGVQAEVWPIPATATTLRWTGIKALPALTSNSDVAALDDLLIVYQTAADELLKADKKNAGLKQRKAEKRLWQLRGQGIKANAAPTVPGSGSRDPRSNQSLRVVYAR